MKIALTGATGFLGRYLAARLAEDGHALRCTHRATSDRSGFAIPAAHLEWLDVSTSDAFGGEALVRGCDAVIHAALERPGRGFMGAEGHVPEFVERNLMATLRLVEAARAARVPRFVFISTCAVHDVVLDDRPLDEAHPLWPKSHYGAHKAAIEAFVHSYGSGDGYAICALRPTGIYGLAHSPSASKWFELVGRVVRGEDVACRRGGKEVHAADVARAVALLLGADAGSIAGQSFNCYDLYVSELDVATMAREQVGGASRIDGQPTRPRHQIITDKIRALGMAFGGRPLLERTVAELVAAHR